MAKKRHQLYLDTEYEQILEKIIALKELDKLDTVSQVVRFIILDYYKLLTKKTSPDVRLNAISKELSMTLNLVTSLINKVGAEQKRNEDVLQYHQSEKYVEQLNENQKMAIGKKMENNLSGKIFDKEEVMKIEEQKEQEKLKKRNDELARFLDSI